MLSIQDIRDLKYKCALLGSGRQSTRLAEIVKKFEFELTILLSKNTDTTRHFLSKLNFDSTKITNKIQDVITTENLKIAFVATPDKTHYNYTTQLLNSGINVYLEKPISLHVDEALSLIKNAVKNKLILLIGYHLRGIKSLSYIKKLIFDDFFDQIKTINIEWHYKPESISGWRNDKNAWWCASMLGTHCLDLLLWFFGWNSIVDFSGKLDNKIYHKNDDSCNLNIKLINNIQANIECSLGKDKPLSIEIISNKGKFKFDHLIGDNQYIILSDKRIEFEYTNPWEQMIIQFISDIKEDKFPMKAALSAVTNTFIFENLHNCFINQKVDLVSLSSVYKSLDDIFKNG